MHLKHKKNKDRKRALAKTNIKVVLLSFTMSNQEREQAYSYNPIASMGQQQL